MTRRAILPVLALPVIAVCATSTASVAQEPGPRVAVQRLPAMLPSVATVDVSANGRFVAFVSAARLDAADVNAVTDVYVLDRSSGRISLESVALDGATSDGSSGHPRLSGDGRYLVFMSVATNLTAGPGAPIASQVLRRDRDRGTTVLVSHTPANAPGNAGSARPK